MKFGVLKRILWYGCLQCQENIKCSIFNLQFIICMIICVLFAPFCGSEVIASWQ